MDRFRTGKKILKPYANKDKDKGEEHNDSSSTRIIAPLNVKKITISDEPHQDDPWNHGKTNPNILSDYLGVAEELDEDRQQMALNHNLLDCNKEGTYHKEEQAK